ncbi:LCP family protein [Candidatus Microgenomates bacterium]|nr:LCP family protein [Candidatus Microgenomates bacterium]
MGMFSKERSSRRVRRNSESDQLSADMISPELMPRPPKRRWPKITFLVVIALIVAIGLALGVLYALVKITPLAGENTGRVNVMVMGLDEEAGRTDSLMILSVDTRGDDHEVAFLSIPRDLVMTVPQFGAMKVNAAYRYGELNDYPGGGPALLKKTLENNLDLPIHYYAVLEFTGFKKLIDTVGGVEVTISQDLADTEYPNAGYSGYDPFELAAGTYNLDGELALKVVRCRKGTCGDDYGRAERQQQVLLAFKQKLSTKETILNWPRLKALKTTLEEHLHTNFSWRAAAKLGLYLRQISETDTSRHVLSTSNYLLSDGSSDLYPSDASFAEIKQFIEQIFEQPSNNLPSAQR